MQLRQLRTQGGTELETPWSGLHGAVPAPEAVLGGRAGQLEHARAPDQRLDRCGAALLQPGLLAARLSAHNDFIKAG